MCILCKEWLVENMNIKEVRRAGMELLNTCMDYEEYEHIRLRMLELEREILAKEFAEKMLDKDLN